MENLFEIRIHSRAGSAKRLARFWLKRGLKMENSLKRSQNTALKDSGAPMQVLSEFQLNR